MRQMSLILNMISDGGVSPVGTMISKRNPDFLVEPSRLGDN